MARRLRQLCLPIVALVVASGGGAAAAGPLQGVKLAVPSPQGASSWGASALGKALKKELEGAGAELIPAAELKKAARSIKLKSKQTPEALAELGKAAGADYVLHVKITKKGWLYTAQAILVSSEDAALKMDFKAGFYKPKDEADDRGARIARVTIERMSTFLGGPTSTDLPPPPEPEAAPEPTAERPAPAPAVEDERVAAVEEPPPPAPAPAPSARESFAPAATPMAAETTRTQPTETSIVEASVEPAPERGSRELIRATLTAGSGVLHSFNASGASGPSTISYQLKPLSLFAGDAEVLIPSVGVGVLARAQLSPLRFTVTVGDQNATPGGMLLDLAFGVRAHFELAGEGRDALVLAPIAGLRLISLGVDAHPGDIVHGSRSWSPFLGAELRYPVSAWVELLAAVEGGFVVSYTETPVADGALSGGFLFGAALGARVWLADAVGIALDARFDNTAISLTGPSDRQPPPPDENLTDVSLSTRDLRVAVGLAFRI
ncbi:MAG: hypothetical protein IT384_27620 [Deltaproteobacteria bacterium]|nr:hypothetical protein [Deltaproteobacteria bacterium]